MSLKDVVFEPCELREAMFSSARFERVEVRACDLAGLRRGEAPRRARMPSTDILENAVLFASLAGIEIPTDDERLPAAAAHRRRGMPLRI